VYNNYAEKLKTRKTLWDIDVDGRIISKWGETGCDVDWIKLTEDRSRCGIW
jgi:hypothetical protein